jgi:MerR family regulatory protein
MAGGVRGLTIGEAATLLAAEFPGLTVSALRRLEAQGLVDPDRTSAGYRRYDAEDLTRLRAVLSGIQDPLWPDPAVSVDEPATAGLSRAAQAASGRTATTARLPSSRTPSSTRADAVPVGARSGGSQRPSSAGSAAPSSPAPVLTGGGRGSGSDTADAAPADAASMDAASVNAASVNAASSNTASSNIAPTTIGSMPTPPSRRAERRWPEAEFFAPDLGEVALTRDQLASAARAERAWIDGLVEFGLLPDGEPVGGAELLVARASAELAQFGVEPRHLRVVAASAARVAELVTAAAAPGANRDPARRERSALAAPGRSAEAAAAAVRLHAALVRAALLRA